MIDDFDQNKLQRRRAFLESRAKAHLRTVEANRRWHLAAAATLLRDAAAVALMLEDVEGGRRLMRDSANRFLDLGFAGGLQLLYIAGALDTEEMEPRNRIDSFARAFFAREERREMLSASPDANQSIDEESFGPAQLLRAYQALSGRRAADDERLVLRNSIRGMLDTNASMPVGSTRTTLATYLATFDWLAKREQQVSDAMPGGIERVLNSLAQRRQELFVAARRDRLHWRALLRPAELVDFDLLALLLAGLRRGQATHSIASAFSDRDEITALPHTLANALST